MARPQFQAPIFPNQDSPSDAGTGKCGSSYHTQYEVRSPYKSTNKYSTTLPVAYGETEIGIGDIKDSLPAISKASFLSALKAAIQGASEILQDYGKDGFIDATNKAVIIELINRAVSYMNNARKIREWWEGKYQPDSEVEVYGWQLTKDNVQGCNGFAPEKGGVYNGNSVTEFTCPTTADRDLHDADRQAYQQLLYAAMLNARCAQEAAATVGIYNKNKKYLESGSGGLGLATVVPPKKAPIGKLATGPVPPPTDHPDDPGSPPADTVPPDDATATSTPKKKKDNTMLLVGAAGLGLLIMKGRK